MHDQKKFQFNWLDLPDKRRVLAEAMQFQFSQTQKFSRGELARFILLGPDDANRQAYAASSRLAQAWNALTGIGLLYGFEIVYRAGLAALTPPPPAHQAPGRRRELDGRDARLGQTGASRRTYRVIPRNWIGV